MIRYRRAKIVGLAAGLAAVVLLGACGDGVEEVASPAGTEAADTEGAATAAADCPLTTAQVSGVVGEEMVQVDISIGCRWEYESIDESTATITYAEVTYTPQHTFAVTEEALEELGATPVDGIGDEAYVILPSALLVGLGDQTFEIAVDTNASEDEDLVLAQALARLVIAST